jgi:CheY-like chemotaxis protein
MTTEPLKRDYSILIVDDDEFLLNMYAMKFSQCGCLVQSAPNGAKALDLLRNGANPNIILLDIMMPEMSGFDFLEKVREEKLAEKTIIIMLTNQGQKEDIERALALGASGYIVKASAIPSEVLEKTIAIADKGK